MVPAAAVRVPKASALPNARALARSGLGNQIGEAYSRANLMFVAPEHFASVRCKAAGINVIRGRLFRTVHRRLTAHQLAPFDRFLIVAQLKV